MEDSHRCRPYHANKRQYTSPNHGDHHGKLSVPHTSAAAVVLNQTDLLELILTWLNLPALRLLKAVNKRFVASARRTLLSPSWLALENGNNLYHFRRLFASMSSFELPMRVVLEHFSPDNEKWSHTHATLLHIRVKRHGRGHKARLVPLEILLEVEGEGLHEDPVRLQCCASGIGYDNHYTRRVAWDLSTMGCVVKEANMGLGLIRPVLSELSEACCKLCEPPVVGSTLAEIILRNGVRLPTSNTKRIKIRNQRF
jgi:hypothetical protein